MLDLIPGDEESFKLGRDGGIGGGLVLGMEEIACAVGRGFHDDHRQGAEENAGACGADDILGGFAFRLSPDADLGEMDERVGAATATVGALGCADLDFTFALGDTGC